MVCRRGISHFLQVVIMVALVSAIGIMMYTGAIGLFGTWSKSYQIIVPGAYLLGPTNLAVGLKNTGNAPANIVSLSVTDGSGNTLGSNKTTITINPGKTVTVDVTVSSGLTSGDIVNIVVNLDDGSLVKFTVPLQ